jgi:hypothetical protein
VVGLGFVGQAQVSPEVPGLHSCALRIEGLVTPGGTPYGKSCG